MGRSWDRLDVRQPGDPTLHLSGAGPFDRAKVRNASAPSYGGSVGPAMQEWHERWAREALRVLKPGGHLLAFGGTRTHHRLACAIEDAGFEIRDCIQWWFGSGFPKSLNVGKMIDKAARGVPQGVADPDSPNAGKFKTTANSDPAEYGNTHKGTQYGAGPGQFMREQGDIVALDPQELVEEAQPWAGWGTALKPAYEIVVCARKPDLNAERDSVDWSLSRSSSQRRRPVVPDQCSSCGGVIKGALRNSHPT